MNTSPTGSFSPEQNYMPGQNLSPNLSYSSPMHYGNNYFTSVKRNKLIFLFLCVCALLFIYSYTVDPNNYESFDGSVGHICTCCNNKDNRQCLQCENCGICVNKNKKSQCVKGDVHGPYSKTITCDKWKHSDPFYANTNNPCNKN